MSDDRAESVLRLVEQASRRSRWDSTVRPPKGTPASGSFEPAPPIPADLLSDRLDDLERAVNQLEWSVRQLRQELNQARREHRESGRSRLRWRLAALALVAWIVGSAAGGPWRSRPPASASEPAADSPAP